jgi:hypothetical protein
MLRKADHGMNNHCYKQFLTTVEGNSENSDYMLMQLHVAKKMPHRLKDTEIHLINTLNLQKYKMLL